MSRNAHGWTNCYTQSHLGCSGEGALFRGRAVRTGERSRMVAGTQSEGLVRMLAPPTSARNRGTERRSDTLEKHGKAPKSRQSVSRTGCATGRTAAQTTSRRLAPGNPPGRAADRSDVREAGATGGGQWALLVETSAGKPPLGVGSRARGQLRGEGTGEGGWSARVTV